MDYQKFGSFLLVMSFLALVYYLEYRIPIWIKRAKEKKEAFVPDLGNDKLILIQGAPAQKVKKALKDCFNMYKDDFACSACFWPLSEQQVALTFPEDLCFDLFCRLVNYLKFPMDISYEAEVKAWFTASNTDKSIPSTFHLQRNLIFNPQDNPDYIEIVLVNEQNSAYKFDAFEPRGALEAVQPEQNYHKPTVDMALLKTVKKQMIKPK